MESPIQNMRIRLYGVQGSGSSFPSREERQDYWNRSNYELLSQFVERLRPFEDTKGQISFRWNEFLGGPPSRDTLQKFLAEMQLPEQRVYGGWTTCIALETSDGYDIVFDCGSGFRNCAKDLQSRWKDRPKRELHVFGSHSHLDHTEGFDQAAVCFDSRNALHVYGNGQFLRALDTNLGIFSRYVSAHVIGVQTPVFYEIMPAKFHSCQIYDSTDGERPDPDSTVAHTWHDQTNVIQVGKTRITAFDVHHPAPCLAYRVEHGNKVFVFCTDHELRLETDKNVAQYQASRAAEERVRRYSEGADLLYRDGQYLEAEYRGEKGIGDSTPVSRRGWGHSCIENVVAMARECHVMRTLIGHHDPNRTWAERRWLDEQLERTSEQIGVHVELAQADLVVDL
ncbi:MAG: hypothetical protein KDA60_06495 [Planctomycetales bacterium]|nr:hypothetical protein [Planctomycetales bacterium]